MKKMIMFVSLLIIFISTAVLADPYGDPLFAIRFFNRLYKEKHELSYIIILPRNEYYYVRTESGEQNLVEDRIIEGKIKAYSPLDVPDFTLYGYYDPIKGDRPTSGTAKVTVIDPVNARIVWKGEFNWDKATNQITQTTEMDNKKHYQTHLDISGGQWAPNVDIHVGDKHVGG